MKWKGPFASFPRDMGFPSRAKQNRVVYNMDEMLKKVQLYNGRTHVFTSLYSFDKIFENGIPDYDSARIEHIYFDLDNGTCMDSAQKLHEFFLERDLLHTMFFSGAGFHLYLAVQYPNQLKNKKSAIFNAVVELADKLKFKVGINEHSDIDAHTVGNVAQLVRVPNTYNVKRRRFCIPIYHEDFEKDMQHFYQLAKTQRMPIKVYGSVKLDLSVFDREPKVKYRIPSIDTGQSLGVDKINVDAFLPCIQALLTKKNLKHRERFIVITYCKEIGLPLRDCILLLKKYLPNRTFQHCVFEERQPLFIYRRADLMFPSCGRLMSTGACQEDCQKRSLP